MKFVKKLDFLSPPITFYFKGEGSHSSVPSAILTIIAYALVFAATIYYFLAFLNKDSPKAYFFTRYIEDAGYFPVNASSMFNYVQFIDKFDSTKLGVDFSVVRVVGVNKIYYEQYMDDKEVLDKEYNFWVYGHCNTDSDIKGIEDLIDSTVYHNAACIREYYDYEKKRYFKTGEEGFVWPVVERGCSNPKSAFYGLIIQRCDKAPDKLMRDYLGSCGTKEYIDDAISKLSFKYQILDQYADMLNYETPFIKYFYEVASAITDGTYICNHLNFNPADMLTHNGIFFDNQVREPSYFFIQNEKHTIDQALLEDGRTTNGCLMAVYFWMQNTLQHYERNYDRFQDFLSDVGGISSIITTIGYFLNLLINSYITILDTQELILSRDGMNFGDKRRMSKRPTFMRKVDEMEYPPKKKSYSKTQKKEASSSKRIEDDISIPGEIQYNDVDIYSNKNSRSKMKKNLYENQGESFDNEKAKNSTSIKPFMSNNKNSMGKYIQNMKKDNFSNNNTYDEEEEEKEEKEERDERDEREEQSEESEKNQRKKYKNSQQKGKKNKEKKSTKKYDFNWFQYISYLICCGSNNKIITYFEDTRASLISEENIIQSYLDVYKLLKLNGIPKKDIFTKYKS